MKNSLASLCEKEATKKVLASLISILIGLLVGAVVVTIVGLTKEAIGLSGMWDGIRIVFVGIFCKGRDAAGAPWSGASTAGPWAICSSGPRPLL